MLNNEALVYSNPTVGAAAVVLSAAATLVSIFTLHGVEQTREDILARLAATTGVDVVRFGDNAEDRPHRLVGTLRGKTGSADGQTGAEDVYGVLFGQLDGVPTVELVQLFSHAATFSDVTVGVGRESGAQVLQREAAVTTTGVLEGLTGGAVTPKAWGDGAQAGWSLADIGPFRAILRAIYKGTATGVTALHMRWA